MSRKKEQLRYNLTEGKILGALISFMLPILGSLFLQMMYGAVDLLIVGQFGGEHADVYVSAVSTGAHLMHTVTFVITGLAMGLTISIGRCVGAGNRKEAEPCTSPNRPNNSWPGTTWSWAC